MSKKHHAPNKNRMAFAAGNPHIFEMFPPAKVPATAEYAGLTANNNRIPKNSPASLGAKAATHPGSTIITKTEANSQIHHFLFIYNHFFLSRCEVQKMLQRSASGATIL